MDLLLEYLSTLKSGSWETFRNAASEVARREREDPPRWTASVVASNLGALGHAEFAFESTLEWEIMPSCVLTSSALGDGCGFLAGARSRELVQEIERAAQGRRVAVTRRPQSLAPSVIELRAASEEELAGLAAAAGIALERDTPRRLAQCLPSIASLHAAAPEASLPVGFPTYKFDTGRLEWMSVAGVGEDGSYRFDCYRPEYRIVRNGSARKVARSVAAYHALGHDHRRVTVYRSRLQELLVPARVQLPELYTRVLTLYTGRLPDYDSQDGVLRFGAIPAGTATVIQRQLWEEGHHE